LIKRCFKVNKPSLKLKNNSALLANLELSQFQKIFDPSEPTIVAPRVNSKSAELVSMWPVGPVTKASSDSLI